MTEATTTLTRAAHHCHILEPGNESYRFRHSTETAKTRIKAREQRRSGTAQAPQPAEPETPL